MLKNTFIHIGKIGEKTEKRLWQSGVTNWEMACDAEFGERKREKFIRDIGISHERLKAGDGMYFAERLPANEHWRMFNHFRNSCAYFDIETTGLGRGLDYITTISIWDGSKINYYIHGQNLDDFPADIEKYSLLVSFNGRVFDVPFINSFFGINIKKPHIDLRFVLGSLGYKGGLKKIEKRLGIDRGDLDGVDGYTAVLLWQEYKKRNNKRALDTLLAYNIEDVVNLESLMYLAYNKKIEETPFKHKKLEYNEKKVDIPFTPDRELIEKFSNRYSYGWHR